MAIAHVLTLRDEHNNRFPPEHWRKRAQEAWEIARQTRDPESKHEMETIARLYQKLAEYAERRLSGR
jgi:hypothetical protein